MLSTSMCALKPAFVCSRPKALRGLVDGHMVDTTDFTCYDTHHATHARTEITTTS